MSERARQGRGLWREFASEGSGLIHITATTSGAAQDLHTATDDEDYVDELVIRAANNSGADVLLSLGIGGVAAANLVETTIPFREGFVIVTDGLRLEGGATVQAWAATTAVINVKVDVVRRAKYEVD